VVEPSIGKAVRAPVLVVGAASRDLDPTHPRGWRLGGTVSYASLTLARLGVAVHALVGVDREAATATELDVLRAAGVDVVVAPLARGPVFDNRKTPEGRVQVAQQVSDPLPPAALPADWRDSPTVLLGPVAAELGPEWATAVAATAFVALAWQGLLRELLPGEEVRRVPLSRGLLVQRANVVFVSAEDVRGGQVSLADLIGPEQTLIVTRGDRGAVALCQGRGRYVPPLPRRVAIDSTGAGDVFMAAWLAARALAPDTPDDRHLAVASAMASLSVEARSVAELPGRRELCEVLVRLRDRHLG
jgi:hypothetical protein